MTRHPAESGPATAPAAAGKAAPSQATVTVMTFNIHHGQGTDGVLDLARIARVIRGSGADIAGLQEVDRNYGPRSDWADQAAGLAELLNWQVAYGANVDRDPPAPGRPRIEYGNAVLSRYPIARWENTHLFRSPGAEQRGLLHTEIDGPAAPLHVYVTHLDAFSWTDRVQQARQVAGLVAEHCPAVLLGDFNARPQTPEIGSIRAALTDTWTAAAGGVPLAAPPAEAPAARIDYIFTSRRLSAAWTCVSTDDPAASDHAPVVSRLALAAEGSALYNLPGICRPGYIPDMATSFQVLAEPTRRRILDLLLERPRLVGELAGRLGLSQPGTSKHLRALREAGLVQVRQDAQRRWYELQPGPLVEIDAWLQPYRGLWAESLDALERHLDTMPDDPEGDSP